MDDYVMDLFNLHDDRLCASTGTTGMHQKSGKDTGLPSPRTPLEWHRIYNLGKFDNSGGLGFPLLQ